MKFSNKFVPLAVLILVAALAKQAFAEKHNVGGAQGWDQSTDFDTWASHETFKVGDTLEFKYTSMHSVVELGGEDAYKKCDVGTALNSYNDGSTTIKLDKTGTRYFACGTSGHCDQGMKVKITTVAANGSSSSSASSTTPSATTSPSSPGATPSTSASSYQLHFLSFFVLAASFVVSFIY